jgi:hypothetical protein
MTDKAQLWQPLLVTFGAVLQIAGILLAVRPIAKWWGFMLVWKFWRNTTTKETIEINRMEDLHKPPDQPGEWKRIRAPRYVPGFTDEERTKAARRIWLTAFLLIAGIVLQVLAVWLDYLPSAVLYVIWTDVVGLSVLNIAYNM